MEINYIRAGLIFISSLLFALLLTPISIWLAKKAQILDYPGKTSHTIHKNVVPKAGGIALVVCLSIISILFGFSNYRTIIVIFLGAFVIFLFGIWDDRFSMSAPIKLVGQLCAVTFLVMNGIRVQFFENREFFINLMPIVSLWIDILITYFWIIAITNAFNLVDSMDGLALGLAEIITVFFIFSAFISGQQILLLISSALFGVNLGIFFFNRFPAKTFLGDSGAQTLGFILSAIAIIYSPRAESQSSTWFIPIIVFGVPIFDTTLVTITRAIKGIPFYKANLDHTYHRLVGLGWKKNYAVTVIHVTAIVCGLVAALCVNIKPLGANILFAFWMLIFISLIIYLEKKFINS
jgi:UDP-GlcNAc:undecaprenyl-phosphate/decaprenyl-phosphate GlcNAc-1-phosphate transferase